MPRKKAALPSTGMVVNEDTQNDTKVRKAVARKPSAKAKKSTPRQIIKVKIVSPNSVARTKKTTAKVPAEKKTGVVKRKVTKTPRPLKIKKMLTTPEKIAFADQVAHAQLVPGPAVLEEPVAVHAEPTIQLPKSKRVRQKVTKKSKQSTEENLSDKCIVPRRAVESASAEDGTSSGEQWSRTKGSVKRKATRKRLMRRKQALPKAGQENMLAEDIAASTPTVNPTKVIRRRGRPKKILLDAVSTAEVNSPPRPLSQSLLNGPAKSTPVLSEADQEVARKIEENLTRPVSKISDTFSWAADISSSSRCTSTSLILFGGKLPTLELVDCRKFGDSSDFPSLTSRESDMDRPRKRKAPEAKPNNTCKLSKRQKVKDKEQIDMRRPKEERHVGKAGDETTSEKESTEESSRSAEKRDKVLSDEIPKREQGRLRVDGLLKDLKSKWSTMATTTHVPLEKNRDKNANTLRSHIHSEPSTSTQTKNKSPLRSKRSALRDDKTKENNRCPKEPQSTPEVTSSPDLTPSTSTYTSNSERLPANRGTHFLKNFDLRSTMVSPKKKLYKTARAVRSPDLTEPSTSNEMKVKAPPRNSCLQSDDSTKDTNWCPAELSTPNAGTSPSLGLTSSTSISMSISVTTSTGSEREKQRIEALDRLQRSLRSVDLEFIEWLSKEEDLETNDPIPDMNLFRDVFRYELEIIRLSQMFNRDLPDLSSSEKSVENKSDGLDMQSSDTVCSQDIPSKPAGDPMDVPDAPMDVPDAPVGYKWPCEYIEKNRKHYESSPDCCDDDVISLYAESFSGFDSVRNVRSFRVSSPCEDPPEPPAPPIPAVAPTDNAPVVKTKTTDIRKQNADSSTYINTNTSVVHSSELKIQTPTVTFTPKPTDDRPRLMSDIQKTITPSPLGSVVFNGVCFFNLLSKCKKKNCHYLHVNPEQIAIKNKLAHLSEQVFVKEYLLLRRTPILRRRYIDLYVDECQKRDLTRYLVEMASDAVREDSTIRTYVMETTLLHLNDKDLEMCKDILINPLQGSGDTLCAVFMRTIAETQNFSRFKPVFLKLTNFLVERHRKVACDVATHIFERICILPYEEALAKAAILLLKSTSPTIFENGLMTTFLDRLEVNNVAVYKELLAYKPYQAVCGGKAPGTQPAAESVRYTSPDTTHLDGLQNKPPEEAAARAPESLLTRTFLKPALLAPPAGPYANHAFGRLQPNLAQSKSPEEPPGPYPPYDRRRLTWHHRGLYRGSPRMMGPRPFHDHRFGAGFRRGTHPPRPFHWA